ncbi:hypothetical protein M0R45_018039 [Rubus argutus]|uniref:Uncharacterized protein n=1 Tax=Rubus argutus TaxID=59490 RepID=A0AAW1XXJ9_RUBAR
MSHFVHFFSCVCPNPHQIPKSSTFFLTLHITLHLLFSSIPIFHFSTTSPSYLLLGASTKIYSPNFTPANTCHTGTPPELVDVAGPVVLCARWFPPPRLPILSPLVFLSLFVQMVSRMMVDGTLASGREALVGVLRSAVGGHG